MGLEFNSPTSHTVCIERHSRRQAEGREWSAVEGTGVEGTGVEGREGQGRAGQGRAGQGRAGQGRAGQGARLLRWTFTGRDFIPLNTPVERAAA